MANEARFAATGRALDKQRQPIAPSALEQIAFVGGGLVKRDIVHSLFQMLSVSF
jgi:hypothetical protein